MLTQHPVPIHIKAIIWEHYAFRARLYMCVINKFLFYLEFDFPECDTESTLILLDAETKSINFLHLQRPPGCIQPKLLFLALAGRGG